MYKKRMKSLQEELQQAYSNGYSAGKNRGMTEQKDKDDVKIAELERKISSKNKKINEFIAFENEIVLRNI